MDRYKRKETEHTLDYLLRLTEIKIEEKPDDLDWADIKDLCGFDCHYDSIRKALQPIDYGGYTIYKYLKEKYANIDYSEDDLIKQLQETKRELYKERQKLRDEKNEYSAWLREQSRMELFYERIDESINRLLKEKPININKPIEINNINQQIICAFADAHYDVEFEIKGFDSQILNKYNPEIFKQRMCKLKDELIDFCKINNCKSVSLIDLGDSIEGLLHISQLKSLRNNIVDGIMDYTDFIIDWLKDLSEYIQIDFYTSEGNHSDLRLLTGKKGDFPHENLEKIYTRFLIKAFEDNPNVHIYKSLNGLNYFNVNGFNILTAHGNFEKNIKTSIKEYEDTYDININYFLVGHLHCKNEIEIAKGKEVIQVRSIMGINEYSTMLKRTSDAGAIMFTIDQEQGKKYINEVKFN